MAVARQPEIPTAFKPMNIFTTNHGRLENGSGHLGIEMVSGQSAATSVWATSPLKILVPRSRGQSVWAFLSSFGGGLVAGDQTSLSVHLETETRCFLGTQASTKVYRNPHRRPCGHRLKATLREGSVFVIAPDPVQAFAGSSYVQRQEFWLERGSGLVLIDWLSAGRSECGERWTFDHYQSRNDVFLDGERVFLDSLLLEPDDIPLNAQHRMARFNCVASVLIIGEPLHMDAERVLAEIAERPVAKRASMICSASPVAGGVVLRIAGDQVEIVGREIHRLLAFLPVLLHDDPWTRKW